MIAAHIDLFNINILRIFKVDAAFHTEPETRFVYCSALWTFHKHHSLWRKYRKTQSRHSLERGIVKPLRYDSAYTFTHILYHYFNSFSRVKIKIVQYSAKGYVFFVYNNAIYPFYGRNADSERKNGYERLLKQYSFMCYIFVHIPQFYKYTPERLYFLLEL